MNNFPVFMAATRATISFTAPQFSELQWAEEKHQLTADERRAIEQDRTGIRAIPRETTSLRDSSLELLEVALQNIPNIDKQAYLEALQRCPAVVGRESRAIQFLRCEEFQPQAAAMRLVRYWRLRRQLFGPVRAFLPMAMEIPGSERATTALDCHDVEELHRGAVQLLPEDIMGRRVIYFRRSAMNNASKDRPTMLHVLFYIFSIATEEDHSSKQGCVLIYDAKDVEAEKFDRKMIKLFYHLVRDCMPIRVRAIHIGYPAYRCVARFFLPTVLWLMGKDLRQRTMIHAGSAKEIAMDLEFHGMKREAIPTAVAGTFDHDAFAQWIADRYEMEQRRLKHSHFD